MPFLFDDHENLAIGQILAAPSPATSGTSITLRGGQGALFPTAPFNCTVWPASVNPTQANAEIVRVTNVTGDVLTITRAQEGTTAKAIQVNYQISNSISVKVITDLETAVNSVVQSVSAGTQSGFGPQIVFADANGISFGMSGSSQITASFSGAGGGSINFSAGTESANLSAIEFADSHNVSFGLDNGTLTASVYQGAQTEIWLSAGTNSQSTGTVVFSNSNGVTFGLDAGGIMTASVAGAAQSTQPVAASASNGSFLFSTLGFSNGNGVTFGTSAGSIITASIAASVAPGVVFSGGTSSANLTQLVFSNSNGVSFGLNGSTLTGSHNALTAQSTQPVAASASNGSFLFSTLGFSNGNGVTFGTSAGSIISASVAAGAAAGSISAGTTSVALGQIVFSNSNNVSFGLNGSTVTASASVSGGGGGNTTLRFYNQMSPPEAWTSAFSAFPQSREKYTQFMVLCPITFTQAVFSGSFENLIASSTSTWSGRCGIIDSVAIFSRSVTDPAATNFSLSNNLVTMLSATQLYSVSITGSSNSWQVTAGFGTGSTSFSSTGQVQYSLWRGSIMHTVPLSGSLPVGEYFMGFQASTTTAGYASASSLAKMSLWVYSVNNAGNWGPAFNESSVSVYYPLPGVGSHTATTNALRSSVALSDISPTGGIQFRNWRLQA